MNWYLTIVVAVFNCVGMDASLRVAEIELAPYLTAEGSKYFSNDVCPAVMVLFVLLCAMWIAFEAVRGSNDQARRSRPITWIIDRTSYDSSADSPKHLYFHTIKTNEVVHGLAYAVKEMLQNEFKDDGQSSQAYADFVDCFEDATRRDHRGSEVIFSPESPSLRGRPRPNEVRIRSVDLSR